MTTKKFDVPDLPVADLGESVSDVLVVDDHPAYRRALRLVIEAAGHVVVGEAETGEDGVKMARALRPQIVLMDVQLPGIGGIEAGHQIAGLGPDVAVVLMTATAPEELRGEIAESGFECLRKDAIRPNTLRDVIADGRSRATR